jgi:hypothetical protein
MPVDARSKLLFDELGEVSSDLAARLRPYLEERGYFDGKTLEVGRAFEAIVKASAVIRE